MVVLIFKLNSVKAALIYSVFYFILKGSEAIMPDQPSGAAPADKEDDWGYDLYPERRGVTPQPKWWQVALFGAGQTNVERTNCERNVYNCFQNSKK